MNSLTVAKKNGESNAESIEADQRLRYWFDSCQAAGHSLAVAFSGGVDSSLVAWYARDCLGKNNVTAYIADSPSLKRSDLQIAISFCEAFDINLQILIGNEMSDQDYTSNPNNRCYYCKSHLYENIAKALHTQAQVQTQQNASGTNMHPTIRICSGANQDDMGDYRPGLEAAAEAQVHHPLLACGIGKKIIRDLAQQHGLPNWDKVASPCMSSRIPYGSEVTADKLQQIEKGEAYLLQQGFPINRVRHYGAQAVIEVPADALANLKHRFADIEMYFIDLGFDNIAIDQEGFVSGKLNRALSSQTVDNRQYKKGTHR